ncbi:helix-turn-helix domain-containing protein [Flavobacterium sp. DSR3-2]|uniref:helix-turn-helix domain-containing protein n=1 Tax=Flavobacterium sp. DSR3-2 TaxID=2804634 RepID=UPI003CFB26C1
MTEFYTVIKDEQYKALVALGATIRRIREETTDFSQSKLAIEIGLSENQVGRIERGESNPTVKTLLKISKALKVDLRSLFE